MSDEQMLVQESGKHTADGVQQELITHTNEFDGHAPVTLLHGCRREHRPAGAQ